MTEYRLQKIIKALTSTQGLGPAHVSYRNREESQHDEGYGHLGAALMQVMLGFRVDARLAPEGHANGAEHVKGGEPGGEGPQPIQPVVAEWAFVGSLQDHVLAEEARKERHAGDGQRSHQEG